MICQFCQSTIFESGQLWGYHQKDLSSLQCSVDEQCLFCSTLYGDLGYWAPSFAQLELPSHFWNIRRQGGISREYPQYFAVSFRPISGPDRGSQGGLPERTYYIFEEQDLGAIPTEDSVGRSSDSAISIAQCRRWMEICQKTHSGCRKDGSKLFTPTRLLDIGSSTEPTSSPIRVVDTKAEKLGGVRYATLSHCWGKKPFINLTPENEPQLTTRGILWHELPKNFQQAITITRLALDVRYIWIDSLCIIQGPDGDFHSEASLMHAVYRNSHCNLAAADSADSSGGLFRLRDPRSILPAAYTNNQTTTTTTTKARRLFRPATTYRILPSTFWQTALLAAPIYTRGWVFQERLLSPRLLHFTSRQIFWDCGTASACEAFPDGLPAPLDTLSATDRHWRARLQDAGAMLQPLAGPADDSIEAFWGAAVRNYTACALTNGADKLVAVWGIAKLVRDALGESYGAGLWEDRLEEQLAWRVEGGAQGWRPRPLRAPSWSWASLDGVVKVGDRFAGGRRRGYVVRNHEGGRIRFQLLERPGRPDLGARRGSSWAEQFRMWDEQQVEARKRRSSCKIKRQESEQSTMTVKSNASQVTNMGDQPSELASWSIAIQGWVGKIQIVLGTVSGKWTVQNAYMDPGAPVVEAFPDERLPSSVHECCFVVLRLNREGAGADESYGDEIEDEDNVSQEECEEDGTDEDDDDDDDVNGTSSAQKQPLLTFSGVGIIMQPVGEKGHFYRTGSLQLKNLGLKALRMLEKSYFSGSSAILDEPESGKGHKIWLD